MPEPSFVLTTLGELRLEGTAGSVLSGRRKELVLLAYLARRAPRPVSRDELAALLWGERDEEKARQSLRQALHQLRQALGSAIDVTNDKVRIADGAVALDATLLELGTPKRLLAGAVTSCLAQKMWATRRSARGWKRSARHCVALSMPH